ncbi:MAG TPA: hypothetical protein VGO71_21410 [Baekduia sp.]|jgi:hypothetical protein|nr:hypothetical protein [Baekduia sp.]
MKNAFRMAAAGAAGLTLGLLTVVPTAGAASNRAEGQLSGVPAAQASAFRALRAAATPASQVPDVVHQFADSKLATEYGADLAQTRRVTAPDGTYWDILPGAGGMCLFVETEQAGTCGSTADATAGKLNISFLPPPVAGSTRQTSTRETKAGLAPDAVTSTTAVLSSGKITGGDLTADGLYRIPSSTGVEKVLLVRRHKAPLVFDKQGWNKAGDSQPADHLTAHAATDVRLDIPVGGGYHTYDSAGTFAYGWWPVHYVDAHSLDYRNICVNAQNQDGTWAGNAACAINTSHVYAHIVRRGIICAQGGGNYAYGFGWEVIYGD